MSCSSREGRRVALVECVLVWKLFFLNTLIYELRTMYMEYRRSDQHTTAEYVLMIHCACIDKAMNGMKSVLLQKRGVCWYINYQSWNAHFLCFLAAAFLGDSLDGAGGGRLADFLADA